MSPDELGNPAARKYDIEVNILYIFLCCNFLYNGSHLLWNKYTTQVKVLNMKMMKHRNCAFTHLLCKLKATGETISFITTENTQNMA